MFKLQLPQQIVYYSDADEANFFRWLQQVPAVKDVKGGPSGLEVAVNVPIDDDSLRELIALLTRYSLEKDSLRHLLTPENEHWFRKKGMYWFESVFT